jgi:hypothetical protein
MNNKNIMTAPRLPEPATRVGVVCGPGEFARDNAGTVLCHVTDRWGTRAVVLMDRGYIHYCHGLTEVGIGTHQLAPRRPADFNQEYLITSIDNTMTLRVLIHKDTDIDSTFRAWDIDEGRFVHVFGWVWTFERAEVKA